MSKKSQTLLVIVATLVLGIVIGAVGSGLFRKKQQEAFEGMPPGRHLLRVMERVIRPTPEQRAALHDVVERRSQQIAAVQAEHQSEVLAILDSLRSDLNAILTEKQQRRLERSLARGARRFVERRVERLAKELNLTEEQRAQVEVILERFSPPRHRPPLQGPRPHEPGPGSGPGFDPLHAEIESVLTPAQRRKFHELRPRVPLQTPPDAGRRPQQH